MATNLPEVDGRACHGGAALCTHRNSYTGEKEVEGLGHGGFSFEQPWCYPGMNTFPGASQLVVKVVMEKALEHRSDDFTFRCSISYLFTCLDPRKSLTGG